MHRLLFEASGVFTCSQAHVPLKVMSGMSRLYVSTYAKPSKDAQKEQSSHRFSKGKILQYVPSYTEQGYIIFRSMALQCQKNECRNTLKFVFVHLSFEKC